jgi:hypothetical protein
VSDPVPLELPGGVRLVWLACPVCGGQSAKRSIGAYVFSCPDCRLVTRYSKVQIETVLARLTPEQMAALVALNSGRWPVADWTAPDAPAPLTEDEQHEAAYQWKDLARTIRAGSAAAPLPVVPALLPPLARKPRRKSKAARDEDDRW